MVACVSIPASCPVSPTPRRRPQTECSSQCPREWVKSSWSSCHHVIFSIQVGHDCTLIPVHQHSLATSAFSRHIPEVLTIAHLMMSKTLSLFQAGIPQVTMFPVFPNPNVMHLPHHDNLRAGLQIPKYPALQIKVWLWHWHQLGGLIYLKLFFIQEEPMNLSWEK